MWVAVGVVVVTALIIGAFLVPPRAAGSDGPLPPDLEAQVLLGETPEPDTDDPRDDAHP